MINKALKLYNFLGKKVSLLLVVDFIVGVLWFAVESGFLFVFQGFLLSIHLLSLDTIKLPTWYPQNLATNLVILSVYGLFRALLTGAKKIIPAMASEDFSLDQRRNILGSCFFQNSKRSTSEIVGAFGDLANKASQFIFHGSHVLSSVAVVCLLLALSIRLAWAETLLSVFLLILVMLPLKGFNKKIRKNGEGIVREWDSVNKVLVDGIKNIFLLRLYNLTKFEFDNGVSRLKAYESHRTHYLLISALISSAPLFLGLIIISAVTYLSQNYFSTDPFHFVAFLYLFMRLAQNISQFNSSLSSMIFYKESFLKLYRWSPESEKYANSSLALNKSKIEPHPITIKIKNLTFGYLPGKEILKNFNFEVHTGQLALIKGPSGIGKSTLIKIIVGMELPQEGEVKINGLLPKEYMNANYKAVAYVGPEPFLIPGTVRDNLNYGNLHPANDEEIWSSLTSLGIDDVIRKLEKKLDEHLHEDSQLSTGQKQRLSFARAILRNPCLLILDEATANIDFKAENVILDYLKVIKSKITIIVISHRESFDSIADKKFNFSHGSMLSHEVGA